MIHFRLAEGEDELWRRGGDVLNHHIETLYRKEEAKAFLCSLCEKTLQSKRKIWDGSLFGYTKIQGSLNSPGYHALLQHRALPDLRQGNGGTLDGLHWMQDGAPPHASDLNIQYLARQFGGRLLARRSEPYGGRDWAARSPDLNPLDYGF